MTYNQVIKYFNDFANNHLQIEQFGSGELWEIEGQNLKYPCMWVSPISTALTDNTANRTFIVLVMDLVDKAKNFEKEVQSDTELILMDVVKYIKNDLGLNGEPVLFPFKEEFADWVTGWRTEITFETEFNSNDCDIPFKN